MDEGLAGSSIDLKIPYLELLRVNAELQVRYDELEDRYLSMCRAARASTLSWLDTLACDGDPDLTATAAPVAVVAEAS